MPKRKTRRLLIGAIALASVATCAVAVAAVTTPSTPAKPVADHSLKTTTPIKHVVVIFDENISFDHYFGTYPKAANTDGTPFVASKKTPKTNTLAAANLLKKNPNLYPPQRLTPAQAVTCDQNHSYGAEQKAADNGKNDLYVQNTSKDVCTGMYGTPGLTMGYYDGNTVTAEWNYAQQFAMSDNSFGTTFGPSTPGALNLIAGQTANAHAVTPTTGAATTDPSVIVSPNASGVGTIIGDPDPAYDDCSDTNHTAKNNLAVAGGKNIGDLLNAKGVTWGWFQGGFRPTTTYNGSNYAVCGASHNNVAGTSVVDYSPHHSPFQYYASTSNPHHLPPSSVYAIGHTDQANHNYDLTDFDASLQAGSLPAVSFLKAPEYQDGHAGYSDPLDEQNFLVSQINAVQKSEYWSDTAVVIAYDDSDGWYDHVSAKIANGSNDPANDSAICTKAVARVGVANGVQDRCGPGPRLPLLVISPYAKTNYVDHKQTEQSSILQLIEDNWQTGRVGGGSFDVRAGSLTGMFDFNHPDDKQVLLNTDGSLNSVKSAKQWK
ncbi:MAG: alkaline phosphatase family protein [Frankiales bacterium]|nr:alkaline phosphatase family protein [Frankiales bacterium]